MAAPTPYTTTRQVGPQVFVSFDAVWATSDQYADQTVLDLSGLTTYTNTLKILWLKVMSTNTIEVLLEFDADTDQTIMRLPAGGSGVCEVDFTPCPDGGFGKTAAGGTGDIVVTTTGAVSGDALQIYIHGRMT